MTEQSPTFSTVTKCCGALLLVACAAPAWAQGQAPAPVHCIAAIELEAAASIRLVGDVQARRQSTVAAKEAGYVLEFPGNEGEFVEQGDVIAKLETTVLELELESARALAEANQQALAELENGTRPEIIAAARAQCEAAAALKDLWETKYGRLERLQRQNAASQEEFDEARAELRRSEQELARCQAVLEEAVNGPRVEAIAQARARLKAQEAMVARLDAQLERHIIRAPYAGYITREFTEVGEWIGIGGPVVGLVELKQVEIKLNVPSMYAGRVTHGASVRVECDSVTDRLLEGTIGEVVPDVDVRSRLFPVIVRVDNVYRGEDDESGPLLKPGMLARVELPVGAPRSGTYVPKDALVLGGPQPLIYLVADPKADPPVAAPVPVTPLRTMENWVEVRGQVEPGTLVVIQGNERLRPMQPVRVTISKTPAPPQPKNASSGSSSG